MDKASKLVAANVLMGIGIVPMAIWAAFLASVYVYAGSANTGLSDLTLLLLFGVVAYIATLAVAGIGAIWAARILRGMVGPGPQITTVLLIVTGIALVLPWIGLLGMMAVRSIK